MTDREGNAMAPEKNPAREALSRAVGRALADGAPEFVEVPPVTLALTWEEARRLQLMVQWERDPVLRSLTAKVKVARKAAGDES